MDAATGTPVPNVEVRWDKTSARTDETGRYTLPVARGVRAVSYRLADASTIRKQVIVRLEDTIQLDVLVREETAEPRHQLVLDRGNAYDDTGAPIPNDQADPAILSTADELGNDQQALRLGVRYAYSPIWTPEGDAIYYARSGTAARPSEIRTEEGVFRYDLATRTTKQIFGPDATLGPQSIALSPNGTRMIAAAQKEVYLIENLRDPTPTGRLILQSPRSPDDWTVSDVAWAPHPSMYLTIQQRHPETSGARISRINPDDLSTEPAFVADDGNHVTSPLPLGDGRLLFQHVARSLESRSIWIRDNTGAVAEFLSPGMFPVDLDPAGRIFLYINKENLHRRDLVSGLDLVIANSVRSASLSVPSSR